MEIDKKRQILQESGFKCKKCNYSSPTAKGLEVNENHEEVLCDICNTFSPETEEDFNRYINEKIDWRILESFRNSGINKGSHLVNKIGMIENPKKGMLMARPAFGYRVVKGNLIPNEDSQNVKLIFQEFVNGKSLNQLSKNYGLSVNGVKKILKNFTYLGKIRFDSQVFQGAHQPLVSAELFNEAQKRFERAFDK